MTIPAKIKTKARHFIDFGNGVELRDCSHEVVRPGLKIYEGSMYVDDQFRGSEWVLMGSEDGGDLWPMGQVLFGFDSKGGAIGASQGLAKALMERLPERQNPDVGQEIRLAGDGLDALLMLLGCLSSTLGKKPDSAVYSSTGTRLVNLMDRLRKREPALVQSAVTAWTNLSEHERREAERGEL